jgi:hypothetical protein
LINLLTRGTLELDYKVKLSLVVSFKKKVKSKVEIYNFCGHVFIEGCFDESYFKKFLLAITEN